MIRKSILKMGLIAIVGPGIICTSCTKPKSVKQAGNEYKAEWNISSEEAEAVALQFLTDRSRNMTQTKVGGVTSIDYNLHSSHQMVDNEGIPSLHVFNFNPEAFVIVSGSELDQTILAYSTERHFDHQASLQLDGPKHWIKMRKDHVENLRYSSGYAAAAGLGNGISNFAVSNNQTAPSMTTPNNMDAKVDPLMTTTWGQGCGYNAGLSMTCPVTFNGVVNNEFCNKPPTGCIATAAAQIVRYHAPSNMDIKYNFSSMPNKITDGNLSASDPAVYVSFLMRDIGYHAQMNYACDATGSTICDVLNFFHWWGNFANCERDDYDETLLRSYLDGNDPVMVTGSNASNPNESGHAWVIDGYEHYSYHSLYNTPGTIETDVNFFHHNWGWNGMSNGFYHSTIVIHATEDWNHSFDSYKLEYMLNPKGGGGTNVCSN